MQVSIVKIMEEKHPLKGMQGDQVFVQQPNSPQTLSEEDQTILQAANHLFVGLSINVNKSCISPRGNWYLGGLNCFHLQKKKKEPTVRTK